RARLSGRHGSSCLLSLYVLKIFIPFLRQVLRISFYWRELGNYFVYLCVELHYSVANFCYLRFVTFQPHNEELQVLREIRVVADKITPLPSRAIHLRLHLVAMLCRNAAASKPVHVLCAIGTFELDLSVLADIPIRGASIANYGCVLYKTNRFHG